MKASADAMNENKRKEGFSIPEKTKSDIGEED